MTTALIYFGVSTVTLTLLSVLYLVEDAKGSRVILPGFRDLLDRSFRFSIDIFRSAVRRVWKGMVRLVLRYGVYQMVGSLVSYLIALEQRIERTIFRHKEVVGRTDRPRNHLDEIAEHKESVALSDDEKQRLRDE